MQGGAAASSPTIERDAQPWWRRTWPLGRHEWWLLGVALIAVIAVGTVIGLALTDWFAPNAVTRLDVDLARGLARSRTTLGDDLARWGATLSETPVKIGATVAIAAIMLWRWRRWYEALFIAMPLLFEATAFMAITMIVERPRPPVRHLLGSPVASSFPSGHAGAATVYVAIAVVVFRHTKSVAARTAIAGAAIATPAVVGWARMYQGMHHLSDVIAGIVLGLCSVAICARVLGPQPDARDRPRES